MDGDEEQKEPDIRDKYRVVLTSPLGLEVLADILAMTHFGATLDPGNPVQVAEHNVGVAILAKCRVLEQDSMTSVIQALLGVRTLPH